jgi:hypothetical protein
MFFIFFIYLKSAGSYSLKAGDNISHLKMWRAMLDRLDLHL